MTSSNSVKRMPTLLRNSRIVTTKLLSSYKSSLSPDSEKLMWAYTCTSTTGIPEHRTCVYSAQVNIYTVYSWQEYKARPLWGQGKSKTTMRPMSDQAKSKARPLWGQGKGKTTLRPMSDQGQVQGKTTLKPSPRQDHFEVKAKAKPLWGQCQTKAKSKARPL